MSQSDWQRLTVRLPPDVSLYLSQIATINATSQNAELVRCVRTRRDAERAEGTSAPTPAPSKATNETLAQEISK